MTVQELEAKRERCLAGMRSIRSMRRGTISEQYVPRSRQGKKTGEMRGPYYVLSRNVRRKTVSERLRADELAQARVDVEQYKAFVGLCEEFVSLTAQLSVVERAEAALDQEKKRRKSSSNRTAR
jgi:hypothetical protein